MQELLAGVGIAVGVALVFAVQVANDSITSGSAELVRSIAGSATLQLRARDTQGFDQRVLERVQQLPGVVQAAAVLDESASIVGPNGRRVAVDLASGGVNLAVLDGLARTLPMQSLGVEGVMLPTATARALGISGQVGVGIAGIARPGPRVSLAVRGHAAAVRVVSVLGSEAVGALADAHAAIAPLPLIQRLADLPGRVTRVLVKPGPGQEAHVHRELERVAAHRLTVAPVDEDVALLRQATLPNQQATAFFVVVSAIVGLLLAFNAMLLTVPERRRVIASLRIQGVRPRKLASMLLFQACCLGVVASLLGLLVGDALSRGVFHQAPSYLAAAFPLDSQTVIETRTLALSFLGGVLVSCLAAAPPLLDLRRSRAIDAIYFESGEPGHALTARARWSLLALGLALMLGTTMVLILDPSAAIITEIGLVGALLLVIPAAFTAALRCAQLVARTTHRLNMLLLATRALRATTVRALALAATGAIAVFGSVVAEGAHDDLLRGLYRDYAQYVATAPVWVTSDGDYLATMDFSPQGLPARIARLPGVASVRSYQGGFLDFAGRRVWVIARAASSPGMIPSGQIVHGDLATATAHLRSGGWITLSQQIAAAQHVALGGTIVLPTPTGTASYRVAATTSNLGWTSGALILNSADYRRAWGISDPSALEVSVRDGSSPHSVRAAIRRMLGPSSPLQVQTRGERAAAADALAREGLGRLGQISQLLIVAAALAMAAAMGAAIWQRRPSLASLRLQSFQPRQLQSILLCESGLVLGIGCAAGALAGVYGHFLGDRYLSLSTGFPAAFTPSLAQAVALLALAALAALLVLAIPGYLAARVPPGVALDGQ